MSSFNDALKNGESLDPWAALATLRATTGPAHAGTNNPRVELAQRAKALVTMLEVARVEAERLAADVVLWSDGAPRNHDNRDRQSGQAARELDVSFQPYVPPTPSTALPPQDWWEDPDNWWT